MASYTTYLFLPGHLSMWMRFFNSYAYETTTLDGELSDGQAITPEVTS